VSLSGELETNLKWKVLILKQMTYIGVLLYSAAETTHYSIVSYHGTQLTHHTDPPCSG